MSIQLLRKGLFKVVWGGVSERRRGVKFHDSLARVNLLNNLSINLPQLLTLSHLCINSG